MGADRKPGCDSVAHISSMWAARWQDCSAGGCFFIGFLSQMQLQERIVAPRGRDTAGEYKIIRSKHTYTLYIKRKDVAHLMH